MSKYREKAAALAAQMNLEEKVGQTLYTAPAVESTRRRTQGGKQDGSNGSRYDSHSGRELCPGETVGRLVRPPDGQIRLFC